MFGHLIPDIEVKENPQTLPFVFDKSDCQFNVTLNAQIQIRSPLHHRGPSGNA